MNPLVEEMKSYYGSGKMNKEEFIEHYGTPHVGLTPHSGRFPWGSGKDPQQGTPNDFLGRIEQLRKSGWKETPEGIEREFGINSSEYRTLKTIALNAVQQDLITRAKNLKKEHSTSEVARRMGVNESTVRGWLKTAEDSKIYQATNAAEFLKNQVDKKKMIDVGGDAEIDVLNGISREKLNTALYILEKQGYHVYGANVPQPTNPNQVTRLKVLTTPEIVGRDGKTPKEIYEYDKIHSIKDYISKDGGQTFEKKFTYPSSMDSKRMLVRYADDVGPDGVKGVEKDGVIELRRGVKDLDLCGDRYSQVRILVDKTHYIKGMAIYSDNMPDGIDVVFNTNKTREKCPNKLDVLKEIKNDPDNPFGSAIKDADQGGQYWYTDSNGKKKLGLINKRASEGDWTEWKDGLPSQFLSKQSKNMAAKQLNLAKVNKEAELADIMSLNNPTIKKYYLEKFASSCDGAANDLKAAALPGQKYHVIIPINAMGEDKIYAPRYENGTKLALIRYPHGGIFEIPVLTVDNKNPKARKILPTDAIDAVGISKAVADRLSGADFDGDTVMCIPTDDRRGRVKVTRSNELKGLKGFDSKIYQYDKHEVDKNGVDHYYRYGKEFKIMTRTNLEMGKISNLITDMTLFGASEDELARAVRHSMVVIDAEKHKLDYSQSARDNNITALKKKYQVKKDPKTGEIIGYGGASTIVSRAKREKDVPKRRGEPRINQKGKPWYDPNKPEGTKIYFNASDSDLYYAIGTYDKKTGRKTLVTESGEKISYDTKNKKEYDKYNPIMKKDSKTGEIYFTNKNGTLRYKHDMRTDKSTEMNEVTDARDLISVRRHPMEQIYANYANSMKALANRARMEKIRTGNLEYSRTAAQIYAKEVSSLESKLNDAKKNKPKERLATRLAAAEIREKQRKDPSLSGEDLRKVSQRSITKYRQEVGAIKRSERSIKITDKEWEAIQAGAISDNKLKIILDNSDPDILREKAMPKASKTPNSSQIARMKALSNSNFTINEIAEKMRFFCFNNFKIFERSEIRCKVNKLILQQLTILLILLMNSTNGLTLTLKKVIILVIN